MVCKLGAYTYDPERRLLTKGDEPVKVPAKTLEVLSVLVERSGKIVNRDELMERVWPGLFVEEANISVHIFNLRKVFAADEGGNVQIETFPKQGYRLTGVTYPDEAASSSNSTFVNDAYRTPTVSGRVLNFVIVGASLLVIITLAAFMFRPGSTAAIGTVRMERVAGTENTQALSISPDGKFMAHAVRKGETLSLQLRDLKEGTVRELIPPKPGFFGSVRFSPDGSRILFNRDSTIFTIGIEGGETRTFLENVAGAVAFSPKGDEVAFVRKHDKDWLLMVAAIDGSSVRELAVRTAPDYFSALDISWSPDGSVIAVAAGTVTKERETRIVGVDPRSGEVSNLSEKTFTSIDGLAWLPDGSGIVFGGYETTTAKTRIWLLHVPGGEPKRITNDDVNYGGISVTADGRTILAGQFREDSSVWMDRDDDSPAVPVSLEKHHEFQFINWSPGERILFPSSYGARRDIWVMNSDGTGSRPLTVNSLNNLQPVASPDGKYIVFTSNRAGTGSFNIWRTNSEGGDPRQLTFGVGETWPTISPDSKWVYYASGVIEAPNIEQRVWKVPLEGGEPSQVLEMPSRWPDVSPDGQSLVFALKPDEKTPWKAAVMSMIDGSVRILDLEAIRAIHWTPDGRSISFVKNKDTVSNIWTYPIDGGEPRQITKFVTHTIVGHDWSPDGRLFCSRTMTIRDAFLITDFR